MSNAENDILLPDATTTGEGEGQDSVFLESDSSPSVPDSSGLASLDDVRSVVADENARLLDEYQGRLDESISSLDASISGDVSDVVKKSVKDAVKATSSDGDSTSVVVLSDEQWAWVQDSQRITNSTLLVLGVAVFALIGLQLWGFVSRGWRRA